MKDTDDVAWSTSSAEWLKPPPSLENLLELAKSFPKPIRRKVALIHPGNVAVLRQRSRQDHETQLFEDALGGRIFGMEVVQDEAVPREKWSGRWVMPDGAVVDPFMVRVLSGRFFEWDESDIWWLEKCGTIRKHMEPVIVVIDDPRQVMDELDESFWEIRLPY